MESYPSETKKPDDPEVKREGGDVFDSASAVRQTEGKKINE